MEPAPNTTSLDQPSGLLLTGFPGLDHSHHQLVSIPFCVFYLTAFSGNGAILFIVQRTPSLHEPTYYFLSMLAAVDLGLAMCTLPTTLGLFWFGHRRIGFEACLTQMYFLHAASMLESSVLLAMAFDRFVAISRPLRYKAILTEPTVVKIGLAIVARATLSMLPIPFLLQRLTYCRGNSLSHSFCSHPDLMKLACGDVRVNILYGLVVVLSTAGIDSIFILISYFLIIRTVVKLGAKGRGFKALNTCIAHVCAVLVFFLPLISLSMLYRFGKDVPPLVNTVVAYVYLIVPPALNPIIYSIKSKHIRKAMGRILLRKTDPL
nr:olfactory receptor 51G2-like [Pogona vitticeps]